jgi:hypothetical protein
VPVILLLISDAKSDAAVIAAPVRDKCGLLIGKKARGRCLREETMKFVMTVGAFVATALMSLAGCSTANNTTREEFNFASTFGSLSGVDQVCHYQTFDGRLAPLSITDLEKDCDCEIAPGQTVNYRNTMIVIKQGLITQSEASHSDLGYQGDLDAWRREPSFCFSKDRLSLDESGNLVINAASSASKPG